MSAAHTSESEEMYLITVARAVEAGTPAPVPVSAVAAALDVSVASANEMVRKLESRGMLTYTPYRGVELTAEGAHVAGRVLRTRRLWATFLADHLGLSPEDADAQACDLEHVTSDEAVERLSAFLGDPATGPLGRPIPRSHAGALPAHAIPLTQVDVGATLTVASVGGVPAVRRYLEAEGLTPGSTATLAARGEAGILLELDGGQIHLSIEVAEAIEVAPAG